MEFDASILARVDAWIEAHPTYTRHEVEQPTQGHTNYTCFVRGGSLGDRQDLAVIKVFREAERKARECFGLEHWQNTGLAPKLIKDVDDTMIVMSHIPGRMLDVSRTVEGEEMWSEACRQVGHAAGQLTQVPLSPSARESFETSFYQGRQLPTLEPYLRHMYILGRRTSEREAEFGSAFWRGSLDFIASKLPGILNEAPILYHQDAANLHVAAGQFQGFYDFEMCRVGCATLQLASSMRVAPDGWESFREGWEAAMGHALTMEERERAAAAAHLMDWLEISLRSLYSNGQAGAPPGLAIVPPDPCVYGARVERVRAMLEISSL